MPEITIRDGQDGTSPTSGLDQGTGQEEITPNSEEQALAVMEEKGADYLAHHLGEFHGLGDKTASILIKTREAEYVILYLRRFTGLTMSHDELASKMIEAGKAEAVAMFLEKLTGLTMSHDELASKMIEAGQAYAVARQLHHFTCLTMSHDELASKMIEAGQVRAVAEYLGQFTGLTMSHDELASKTIEAGYAEAVAHCLRQFTGLTMSHDELASKMIEAGKVEVVALHLKNFTGLGDEIASKIIEIGEAEAAALHLDKFAILKTATLLRLNFSRKTYEKYILVQDKEQLDESHLKLREILDQTKLYSSELPKDILERDEIDPEQLVSEVFLSIPDSGPSQELIDLGLTPGQLIVYADREGLSRHDAFLAGADIAKLIKNSSLPPHVFFDRIMLQVQRDDSNYDEGTAHHHLNTIANRGVLLRKTVEEKINEVPERYRSDTSKLFEEFPSDQEVYLNWRSLKSYWEKCNILINDFERIKIVAELRESGQNKLADWYDMIARSKNVSSKALLEFIHNPLSFFEADASYTNKEIHDSKKPSNYCQMPNLDLTAEELRDSLVEGAIDEIASVPSMEIIYEIVPDGKYLESTIQHMSLRDKLVILIGSRKNHVAGLAQNPESLFKQISGILKSHGSSLTMPALLAAGNGAEINEELESELNRLLDKWPLDPELVAENGEKFIVGIHKKSSPHGVLAGNDTACCMPFGDGKAALYMMNPACAQFTIQKEMDDGTRRTVVQSVMTFNVPLPGQNISVLAEKMKSAADLSAVIPDEAVLTVQTPLLVADNAQSAPNFAGRADSKEIAELLYSDFFARYLAETNGEIDRNKVLIGMGYSDVLDALPKTPNETLPVTPLSYSDNVTNPESYVLTPKLASASRVSAEVVQPYSGHIAPRREIGVSDLTYVDTLPTAYLEGKAYQDAQDLQVGINNMENALIAKDINNSLKERPEMSLKFIDRDGKFRSYILTYEGRWEHNSEYSENEDGEPCIYIADLASDREGNSAGYILREFCKRYKENYIDRGNPLPIYAEMRETTSYQLITGNQRLLEKWIGAKIELEEIDSYTRGGEETMHVIRMTVGEKIER